MPIPARNVWSRSALPRTSSIPDSLILTSKISSKDLWWKATLKTAARRWTAAYMANPSPILAWAGRRRNVCCWTWLICFKNKKPVPPAMFPLYHSIARVQVLLLGLQNPADSTGHPANGIIKMIPRIHLKKEVVIYI